MKSLELINSKLFALVSDEDYERCLKLKWFYDKTNGYVVNWSSSGNIYLHNFILGVKKGVDHKDINPLNNQRNNLRLATSSQNQANRPKVNNGSASKYKGVSKYPVRIGWWKASIKKNYKNYYLGIFETELEAAHAYDKKAIELFGEFACLNFSA